MNDPLLGFDTSLAEALRQTHGVQAAYRAGDLIGGQYRVHRTLGQGGFGVVYLVTSTYDDTVGPVAVASRPRV